MNKKQLLAAAFVIIASLNMTALMFLNYRDLNRQTGNQATYIPGYGVPPDISTFFGNPR
jgi:hypothetical protein